MENKDTSPANPSQPPNNPPPVDKDGLSIHLIIRNPQRVLFDDTVKSVTSLNAKGIFDVLPFHENFISLIQEYITIEKITGEKQTLPIKNGIIHVNANETHCYIDLLAAPTIPGKAIPQQKPADSAK